MSKPRILHFLTPLANMSPFDVNMAVDAGFTVAGYTGIRLEDVVALTQDAMFSRAPQDAAKTVLFIGGRDAALALDMAKAAREAMFPPFLVSVFVDPSGAFTTAAALIGTVDRDLLRHHGTKIAGKRVAVFGAKGVVGGIAGVLAATAGAQVTLVAHDASGVVPTKAAAFEKRFSCALATADGSTAEGRAAVLAEAQIVLSCGRAGVQVLSRDEIALAKKLVIAADINAVAPHGIEGLASSANGAPFPAMSASGIGAFTVGNAKFQLQRNILALLHDVEQAMFVELHDAYRLAHDVG